jgi:hypothetical protein
MQLAVIILADPANGSEATARLLNALALADEGKREGDTVEIAFAGGGTRWVSELANPLHPAYERYQGLRDLVRGVSRSCAVRHQVAASAETAGLALIGDNAVAGTPGVLSLRRYYAADWKVALF